MGCDKEALSIFLYVTVLTSITKPWLKAAMTNGVGIGNGIHNTVGAPAACGADEARC